MNNKYSSYNIAEMIALKSDIDVKKAMLFVDHLIELIDEGIKNDRIVKVKSLGTFKVMLMKERESIHVNTGERIVIPAHHKLVFLPDKPFKEQINKPFAFFEAIETTEKSAKSVDLNLLRKKEADEEVVKEPVPVVVPPPIEKREEVTPLPPLVEEKVEVSPLPPLVEEKEEEMHVIEPIISQPEEKEETPPITPSSSSIEKDTDDIIPLDQISSGIYEEDDEDDVSGKQPVKVDTSKKKRKKKKQKSNKGLLVLFFILLFVLIGAIYYYFVDSEIIHSYLHKASNESSFSLPQDTLSSKTDVVLLDSAAMIPALDEGVEPKEVKEPAKPPVKEPKEVKEPAKPTVKKPKEVKQTTTTTVPNKVIATVTMEPGQRLTLIAEKYYGNKIFWVYLYEYNKSKIDDPDRVPTGMKILVPNKEQYNIDAKNPSSVARARKLQSEIISKKK